jgi:hypothetical protein
VPVEGICPLSGKQLRYLFNVFIATARQALWDLS